MIWTFFSSIAVGAGFLIGLTMIRYGLTINKHGLPRRADRPGIRINLKLNRWEAVE